MNYTDDFSRPAVITQTLTVDVMEEIPIEPFDPAAPGQEGEGAAGGEFPADGGATDESLLDRFWRFLRGLFGLGSDPAGRQPDEQVIPIEPEPIGPPG